MFCLGQTLQATNVKEAMTKCIQFPIGSVFRNCSQWESSVSAQRCLYLAACNAYFLTKQIPPIYCYGDPASALPEEVEKACLILAEAYDSDLCKLGHLRHKLKELSGYSILAIEAHRFGDPVAELGEDASRLADFMKSL